LFHLNVVVTEFAPSNETLKRSEQILWGGLSDNFQHRIDPSARPAVHKSNWTNGFVTGLP
jgi:hypothetical protein